MGRKFWKKNGYSESDLILYAMDHIVSAQYLYHLSGSRGVDSAGYLSHLGIELLLKSLLLHHLEYFTDDHRLISLYESLPDVVKTLTDKEFEMLTRWDSFFMIKYPNPSSPMPAGSHQWTEARQISQSIINLMPKHLHDIAVTYGKEQPTQKGGRTLYKL